jgi:hypothetical protein
VSVPKLTEFAAHRDPAARSIPDRRIPPGCPRGERHHVTEPVVPAAPGFLGTRTGSPGQIISKVVLRGIGMCIAVLLSLVPVELQGQSHCIALATRIVRIHAR